MVNLLSGIRAVILWLGLIFTVWSTDPVVMAATSLKRSLLLNTSCFSNLYLFECIRICKSKSYLNSIMMTIGKDLRLTKKKLDCLGMKMHKGVHLRRVKVKGLFYKRQMRENTFPLIYHLSTKCALWWRLHLRLWTRACSTLTATAQDTWLETDLSLRFSSLRKVVMSLLVMGANHRLKLRESSLYLDRQTLQMFYM